MDKTVTSVFARRQGVQSTSSGEAEFYGATSVVMDGRIIKHFLEWLGYEVAYQLHLDSSAAKAMVQRDGVGKVKHMDERVLWIQAERRDHGLVTRKVPGEFNYADLGTKGHPAPRFLALRAMLNIVDCKQIDEEIEIEACSVQAPFDEGWTTKVGRGAMRLERKLLMALLACAPAASDADSRSLATFDGTATAREATERAASTETTTATSWLGWLLVLVLTLAFLCQYVWANYEIRRIPPALGVRSLSVQGPVTYATSDRLSPVCAGRYQPLADRDFGAFEH